MTIIDKILCDNMSRLRTDADKKKLNDSDNFKMWKRVYPDTYKAVIKSMEEYAELKSKKK